MKTLTLYLKITTFFLLIWMYQCFYNCDCNKCLIDKNILQAKNKLKYERVLTEGDIPGKKQTNTEGCLEECPLDDKKNKCKNPDQCENPCDRWQRVNTPLLWERFYGETSGIDPKLKKKKWNVEWNEISANNVNHLSSIIYRRDIPDEEKGKLILSVMKEQLKLKKLLDEYEKEMRDNKTESESKNEMRDNKTESESKKEMRDNKKESESMNEMRESKAESESKKKQGKNKKKNKKLNIWKFLFNRFDNLYENKN
ncbi:fam-g protein [Plasmodium gallinaceum]|uniref:Fam-g protein n=1 Tax=Plasmodium gallinaceum TaxID=5849 RepID=A0A1J1GUB0_PLAGA|nr:fam-g protein [Plasmodium gallinaceum]CRG96047.1 fam-g protein [Plasmodium gallinaceum]